MTAQTVTAAPEMEIVKKLTMKTLCGNLKVLAKPLEFGKAIPLVRVIGLAKGIKTGESQYGPWVALVGDFIAEPLAHDKTPEQIGKRFRSGVLFLPDVALGLVTPYVADLGKNDAIEVAFGIGMRADEEAAAGYVFTARFLRQPQANDPLMLLLESAMPTMTLIGASSEAAALPAGDDLPPAPDGSLVVDENDIAPDAPETPAKPAANRAAKK